MSFFERLRKRMLQMPTSPRTATVKFDEESITCRRPSGHVETIKWSELRAVVIQTTANGPAADDLFWVLVGEKTGCVVPSETTGIKELVDRLYKLPGFDFEAAIQATTCTEDREFLCWKKDA